jgi:4-hydroxy-3-methylbut-2-enyl diphosphate reductase IspH
MNMKDLIGEKLTVAEYLQPEMFPYGENEKEYSHAIDVQKKVCDSLCCTPDFVFIVTSDNTSNSVEFNQIYCEACQKSVKCSIEQYNIIDYDDVMIAIAYEEGGLAVMYIPQIG